MQVVIDIPKEMYENALTDRLCGSETLVNAIKNGRPQETVTEFADRCRECGARYGKLLKQKSGKWDRLYSWLNDMRLGIAPDETVDDIDERHCREAQTDILDEIMEWMIKAESEDIRDENSNRDTMYGDNQGGNGRQSDSDAKILPGY